jgi:hypothetical protein
VTEPTPTLDDAFARLYRIPIAFFAHASGITLRRYQREVADAIIHSVLHGLGRSFAVVFPRQSGKNELQAQIEAYLLSLCKDTGGEIVKVSPTWKPQSLNAMRRLEGVLKRNAVTQDVWSKEQGYIYRVGGARMFFLSGEPTSSIVGATASVLLEVDEAQDVSIAKYDKEIAPMAASTNATRVFWGTAWSSATLLARELRLARALETPDQPRAFVLTADTIAAEVPDYGAFVAEQVARLGRDHPMVRTQFYSQELDGGGGMFPPERIARMAGDHAPLGRPRPGQAYALLLDVAGEDERAGSDPAEQANPQRDRTALTVVEVEPRGGQPPLYRAVCRCQWAGVRHADLLPELTREAERWRARWLVIDATGVGAGLASFLARALPGRVIPFTFSAASKSKLGWDFLALVDAGRWREPSGAQATPLDALFLRQAAFCQHAAAPGPEPRLRWGVPDGARDPLSGERLHDDLLLSAALAAVLDERPWSAGGAGVLIPARDALDDIDGR